LRQNPYIVNNLLKPYLLHTLEIGILHLLQKRIFHFMKSYKPLDKYNAIWLSAPASHNLTSNEKSSEEVSQLNGKELKDMHRYLRGVVTQSVQGASPAQRPIFNRPIECTLALLQFYTYAQYKSRHDETLSCMEDDACRFHTFKDDFLLGRAGKQG
jgi:hypothetical protein